MTYMYEEFKDVLVEVVQENLGADKRVFLQTMKKNNGMMREGITYEDVGIEEMITGVPIAYLDDLYAIYEEEGDLADIVSWVVNVFVSAKLPKEIYDIQNWEANKSRVFMKLINPQYNLDMLETHVHKQFLDLSIIFALDLGQACTDIKKEMLKIWGITEEELYQTALKNHAFGSCLIESLELFLSRMMELELEPTSGIFVLTNDKCVYGASEILYMEQLHEFAREQDCNLYLVPTSRHEMILVRDDGDVSIEDLQKTVYEINHDESLMRWEDYLSDSIYYYDRHERQFSIAA